MALAGLWEKWRSPAGEWVRSFAIITTKPNEPCGEIHNRLPAILKGDVAGVAWRGTRGRRPAEGMLGAILLGGDDVLACQPAGRQHQKQRPEPARSDCRRGGLGRLYRWLAHCPPHHHKGGQRFTDALYYLCNEPGARN